MKRYNFVRQATSKTHDDLESLLPKSDSHAIFKPRKSVKIWKVAEKGTRLKRTERQIDNKPTVSEFDQVCINQQPVNLTQI